MKIKVNLTKSSKLFLQQIQDSLSMGVPFEDALKSETAFLDNLNMVVRKYGIDDGGAPDNHLQAICYVAHWYECRMGSLPPDEHLRAITDRLLHGDILCLRMPPSTKP